MKIVPDNRVSRLKLLSAAALAVATSMTAYAPSVTADGHGALWGIGGLVAGSLLTKKHDQDQAAAYNAGARQAAAAPPPAAASSTAMTPEQKIQQLDKLAAGGYITPAEYKAKKQAILDSL